MLAEATARSAEEMEGTDISVVRKMDMATCPLPRWLFLHDGSACYCSKRKGQYLRRE